jgi:TPR repeat protein
MSAFFALLTLGLIIPTFSAATPPDYGDCVPESGFCEPEREFPCEYNGSGGGFDWFPYPTDNGKGFRAYKRGDLDEAERLLTKALNGAVDRSKVEFNLSLVLYDKAADAEAKGEYGQAKKYYLQSASRGNPQAYFKIGLIFSEGFPTGAAPLDYQASHKYWYQAAALGYPKAMSNLGWLRRYHFMVDADVARAWYKQAAICGEGYAMRQLGDLYRVGEDVVVDLALARNWYAKGAKAGHEGAMFEYAKMLQSGDGEHSGLQYIDEAASWYSKSAALGYAPSRVRLKAICVEEITLLPKACDQ